MSELGVIRTGNRPFLPGDDGLSTVQLARLAGASFRQIDYWTRLGHLQCIVDATGSGSRRLYAQSEVLVAAVLALLSRGERGAEWAAPPHTVAAAMRDLPADAHWLELSRGTSGVMRLVVDLDLVRARVAERTAP